MPRSDPCIRCGGADDEGLILLCDGRCNNAFHAHCVGFKGKVHADWMCNKCRPSIRKRRAQVMRKKAHKKAK